MLRESRQGLPRTTCREPPLREPQGRELVEPAGRTTEGAVCQRRDKRFVLPVRAVPQSQSLELVVRG